MANKGKIEHNKHRRELIDKYAKRRQVLKGIQGNKDLPLSERIAASFKLEKLPRNSSAVRYRRRCHQSGRPRGICPGGIDRITFRNKALAGELPGVTLASW